MSRTRAHIVGVGESAYARWGKIGDVTEHELACQAIQKAVADAGLSMDDVDGLASFAEDRNEAVFLADESTVVLVPQQHAQRAAAPLGHCEVHVAIEIEVRARHRNG